MTVADIHIHTHFSPDSIITPEQAIKTAKKKGLDIICFTDHSIFEQSISLEYYIDKVKNPLIIRGVELATSNGELLIFGLKNDFWNDLISGVELLPSARMVIETVNQFGGVAVWSHPFRSYIVQHYDTDYARYTRVNILEGLNGKNNDFENKTAIDYARNNNFRITGGSDAHKPEEIGKCLTLFRDKISNEEEFINALKNLKYFPISYDDFRGKDLSSLFG